MVRLRPLIGLDKVVKYIHLPTRGLIRSQVGRSGLPSLDGRIDNHRQVAHVDAVRERFTSGDEANATTNEALEL